MKLVELTIKNFRGIKDQTIHGINNALILIGKNNSGKSAILTAIRALWNEYTITEKDFYKGENDLEISAKFNIDDLYIKDEKLFENKKLGFSKVPQNATIFNSVKAGTPWEEKTFTEFKDERADIIARDLTEDISTEERFYSIWLASLKKLFNIQDNVIELKLSCNKSSLKPEYNNKDILTILPNIAFINDTRNFEEEENGKSKTLTSSIFSLILNSDSIEIGRNDCSNCTNRDCETRCIERLREQQVSDLSINDLQKLINYKINNSSKTITENISDKFNTNYRNDFKVNLKATSDISKSFSFSTKIYDPQLDAEIDLSNVGAGVRSIYILSLLQAYQGMCSKHALFLIEEPELYLHPELQKKMAQTLNNISMTSQVIFSTHSPIMLRDFKDRDIRKVKMNELNYQTEVEITSTDEILSEIGYSSQDILNTEYILFVEGPSDKEFFERLIEKYYDVDMGKILVMDTKSCENISFYATLRFLNLTKMSKEFIIIRDADTKEAEVVKEKLSDQLRSNISVEYMDSINDKIYITKYSSIEGYMFSPQLLVDNGRFASIDALIQALKNHLREKKEKKIDYFRKQNRNNNERVTQFINEYDSKVDNLEDNLEWMKINTKGHEYYNFAVSRSIEPSQAVDRLPDTNFEDLLQFLDSVPYFAERRR